jgi:hypothetical protein
VADAVEGLQREAAELREEAERFETSGESV